MKQQASESREGRFYCTDEFYLTCRTQAFNNKDNFIIIYSICVCVCTHCVLKLLKYGESVLGYMSDVLLLSFFRLNVHTSFLVFAFLFRICLNVFRPLKKKRKANYILKFVQNRQKRKARKDHHHEANKRTQTGRDRGKMRARRDLGTFVALFSRRWTSRNSRNVVLGGHVF